MEGPSINRPLKLSLWSCDWDDCKRPAVQRAGNCSLCNKHLCRTHLRDKWHECPKPEENWSMYASQYVAAETHQMDELCRRIDGAKLCARASLCRGGIPCTVNLSANNLSSMMGGQNCHAEITFGDNVKWLARFRLSNISSPPLECRDYILRSEAATMDFLQKRTHIPSPKIFDWACESDPSNPLGRVSYILMEKMEGNPLDWQGANPSQKEKVMQQLVDIFLEIEKHPFDTMGSIVLNNDLTRYEIQGIAHHEVYCVGTTGPLGPFHSSLEGADALIGLYLAMIASGEIEATYPIDVFLMHRFRLDLLNDIGKHAPSGGPFFLKHPDDKGDHILVNEDFDIVGMIDWEWCQIVSKDNAFSSPCMMWPVAKFYAGSNELAEEELRLAMIFRERGREDIAKYILEGRKVQRFFFALGAGSGSHNDRTTMIDLFMGLKRAFNSGEEEWEEWRAKALVRWEEDELLQILLQRNT
ncbi:hypothetical protein F5Y00DRAFT_253168 [Daldinia vernicosa]|uniref:uncharacterized protein n=1 Tax=Daldinia vernicosa TaxID=114800 RepID=UPI002007960F|nr:uncharacterized protein F5Y00DRAFT_253168 [Daldinia vernicosa]KAI0848966.1 hypothetical protein F5Y00DRAFT_253168 [Daldinia vernicosa]